MAKDSSKLIQKINFELSKPQYVALLDITDDNDLSPDAEISKKQSISQVGLKQSIEARTTVNYQNFIKNESYREDFSINSPPRKERHLKDEVESAGRSTLNDHYGFYQNQDQIVERGVLSEVES